MTSELVWGDILQSFQSHTQGNLAGFISSLPDGVPDPGLLPGLKQLATLIDGGLKMSLQVNWGHLLQAQVEKPGWQHCWEYQMCRERGADAGMGNDACDWGDTGFPAHEY